MVDSPYKIEDHPFLSGDLAEDMMGWTEKLEALGAMISEILADGNNDIMRCHGKRIGDMISDYAGALRYYTNEAYPALKEFSKDAARKADARKHLACAKGGAAP